MAVQVLTRGYNNYRGNCLVTPNLIHTSPYVQQKGVAVKYRWQLDDPRGTEGQVLVMPSVTTRSGMKRNLAFVADMSNSIYAFNTDPPYNLIWKNTVGIPMTVTKSQDMWGINPYWGTLSTGVIDPDTGIWYIVALSTSDGTSATGRYYLFSINISDGNYASPPLDLTNVVWKAPSGTTKYFADSLRKQRSALTLVNYNGVKVVYIPFGSFFESGNTNLGWIIGVDVTSQPKVDSAWASGDQFIGAGIWMAGAGPSVTDNGDLLFMTGNGGFNPPGNFGECFVRLRRVVTNGKPYLVVVDWWSPFSDSGRVGLDPTLPSDNSNMKSAMDMRSIMQQDMQGMDMPSQDMDDDIPTNAMNYMMMHMDDVIAPTSNVHNVGDEDLGSGGPFFYSASWTGGKIDIIGGAGKDGICYFLNAANMGKTVLADFAPSKIAGNYAKLLSPPWGLTFDGSQENLAPTQLNQLPIAVGGYTRHVHGQPASYLSPDHGLLMFVQGENGPVRVVQINPDTGVPTYVACGQEIASQGMAKPGGMPGGMLSLAVTAQRANTAVLWACMPWYGNANKEVTAGRLCAYGANWVQDKKYLIKLWDSADWGVDYKHNKFNPPTCQDDKVIVPSYDGTVLIVA